MRINPNIEITDIKGDAITEKRFVFVCPKCGEKADMQNNQIIDDTGEPVRLKNLCINVLTSLTEEDKNLTADKKFYRGKLAERIYNAEEDIDVRSEDIAMLKKLIAKAYSPLLVMKAFEILDPEE